MSVTDTWYFTLQSFPDRSVFSFQVSFISRPTSFVSPQKKWVSTIPYHLYGAGFQWLRPPTGYSPSRVAKKQAPCSTLVKLHTAIHGLSRFLTLVGRYNYFNHRLVELMEICKSTDLCPKWIQLAGNFAKRKKNVKLIESLAKRTCTAWASIAVHCATLGEGCPLHHTCILRFVYLLILGFG